MKVKFLYTFKDQQTSYVLANAGEIKEVSHLNHTDAVFTCNFPLPLNLFFKITEPVDEEKGGASKITKTKKSVVCTYPNNLDDQFESLWMANGRNGAKSKAKDKFKLMLKNESEQTCSELTQLLINDITSRQNEIGFAEMHLTTYINQKRWEK